MGQDKLGCVFPLQMKCFQAHILHRSNLHLLVSAGLTSTNTLEDQSQHMLVLLLEDILMTMSSFSPITPHPVTGESIPIGVGHEFSGTISEVGPGSSQFKVGQKVAIQPTIYCGSCGACRSGVENACANGGFIGLSGGLIELHNGQDHN